MEKSRAIEFLEYLRQDRNLEGTIYGDALNMAIEALKAQLYKEGATSDLISRTATIDAVNNAFDRETLLTGFVRSIAVRAIRDMPTAQPEPHEGHWIPHESPDGGEQYECSECGVLWEFNDGTPEDNEAYYCPKCGAKMKGFRHEND